MMSFEMMQQDERGEIKGAVDSDEIGGVTYLYSLERMGCLSNQHGLRKLRSEVTMSDFYGRKYTVSEGSIVANLCLL
jgi:hypothetical protein